jgi:FKBP-type peptidyl-prolyl cis-trans isomerase
MARRNKSKKSKGSAGNNRKAGEEFLLRNAEKENVTETVSGLQYAILEQTDGRKPFREDEVTIHQRALLLDGKILEDTYRKNEPDKVKLPELIEGLQEGLQLMGEGSRYRFWVPPELGWGRKGTGNKIPPNAVLMFDIRLLNVE